MNVRVSGVRWKRYVNHEYWIIFVVNCTEHFLLFPLPSLYAYCTPSKERTTTKGRRPSKRPKVDVLAGTKTALWCQYLFTVC